MRPCSCIRLISSSEARLIFSFATPSSFPGGDQSGETVAFGIDDVVRLTFDHTEGDTPLFSIIVTDIEAHCHEAVENPCGIEKVQAPLFENSLPLVHVPLKFQSRPIYTKVYTFSSNRPEGPENMR